MLELLERLYRKDYARVLPAGVSQELLSLGVGSPNAITVEYRTDLGKFDIWWWDGTSDEVMKHLCDLDGAEGLIDSFAIELVRQARAQAAGVA